MQQTELVREVVNCDKLNKVLSLSLVPAILQLQH